MNRSRAGAFTLVEIVTCIAIVVALAVIAASVLVRAKERSKVGVEISQMHQLGLAANLYHEQNNAWPKSIAELVDLKFISKEICLSPRDRFVGGWANTWLTDRGGNYLAARANFPNTYLSLGNVEINDPEKEIGPFFTDYASFENLGLFVSILDSQPRVRPASDSLYWRNTFVPYMGIYRRVLLDGSVIVRSHRQFKGILKSTGKRERLEDSRTWFFDPDQKWIDEQFNSY